MLKGQNILCVSNPTWFGDYAKTIVEMMTILAQTNQVLYVENPYTVTDLLRRIKQKGFWDTLEWWWINRKVKPIKIDQANVYVLSPGPVIPINFLPRGFIFKQLQLLKNLRLKRKIKKTLHYLNMQQRLIHVNAFNPALSLGVMGRLNESLKVYYCYDEINAAVYLNRHGGYLERLLMQKVDITFCTSKGLLQAKEAFGKNVQLLENGVNHGLFARAFRSDIRKEKVIGYIGSIDDRLDLPLLETLFNHFPDWIFEFVGRTNHTDTLEFLRSFPMVRLAGAHPPAELPVFLSRYAAGIIPFIKNEFTAGIYPLKINEYLAAGLPVVLTDFGQLADFESITAIAADINDFISKLKQEVENDTPELRKHRRSFAVQNSWENRAEQFSNVLEVLL